MEDKTADEIKKDIKLFNECVDRLKEIGNQNLSLFINNLQQGNLNTIKFLFEKYIKRNKQLEEENKRLNNHNIIGRIDAIKIEDLEPVLKPYYIPKSLVKEKIEELKLKLKDVSKRREKAKAKEEENILWCLEIRLDEKIKTLQELLREE